MSSLENINNNKEILIVCLVTSLGRDYFSKEKGFRIPMANFGLKIN